MNKLLAAFIFVLSLLFAGKAVAQCNATFTYTKDLCLEDSVTFNFTGTGNVSWNFGDVLSGLSNTSTSTTVKHRFTDTGFYTVKSIASNGACYDTAEVQIYIAQKVEANFSVLDACLDNTTVFSNLSVKSYKDTFLSFNWDFGDSTSSTQENPTHIYSSSGNKVITLIVESVLGCKDTLIRNINVKPLVTYQASVDSVCVNTSVNFSVNANGQSITNYNWSFGDGNSASQTSPDYSYSSTGVKYFSVLLTFADGSTCTKSYDSITVLAPPKADFTYLTDTVQCYKGNEVCIKFAANNKGIASRNILWDDGSTSAISIADAQACHSYSNPLGSTYQITHEVIDVDGCAIRLKDSLTVRVLEDPEANFTSLISGGCFKSYINLNNLSSISPPVVERFIWNFGDGNVDSTNWQSPSHTYTADGNFRVSLYIQDTFGCIDTIQGNNSINNVSYQVDAALDSVLDYCRLNNRFSFSQSPIQDAEITWYFGDFDSSISFTPTKHYFTVGEFIPTVRISKFGCDSFKTLDTVTVYGPFANAAITNQYQCQIKDTVYFRNISVPFKNQHLQSYWTLNDPFGGNCTIDTKNGLNTNSNCNNSVDSLTFKHMFTPGTERCFTGYLVQKDTVVGCSDSFFLSVPLMKPNADSGLSVFFLDEACTGPEEPKRVFINLAGTQPNCGRESFYIMWDSLCAEESGNFESHWRFAEDRHNYGYNNMPCDSNGYITMGLILENGLDSFGNTCRDTGFYHKILKLGIIDPRIATSYKSDSLYCNYSTHDFYFLDSMQDSIVNVRWDFGDGTILTVNTLGKVSHTYTSPGVYRVSSYIEHARGCNGIDTFQVKIGIRSNISAQNIFGCLGDSVRLDNTSTYWQNNNSSFFRDDARTAAGKEKTRWDFGLGNGFIDSGYFTFLDYNRIGNYQVRMETTDSLGCLDTTGFQFRVFDIKSEITLPSDTLVCPQVVQLFSSSTVYDSLNNFGHPDDSVSVFIWTFDDGSGSSLQSNPSKFFGKGRQGIKLYTENTRGCKDSIVDSFFIVSPTASFEIVGDSAGCQPHLIEFNNTSINANSFKWEFGDQFNNIFNTVDTSNNTFTYTDYGTFFPRLIAQRNLINNGIPVTCADTFPLLVDGDSLLPVVVYERPQAVFAHTTDCSNNTTSFTNTTNLNTDTILSILWIFGDGDSSTQANPIHQYSDTGAYRVVMYVTASKGCTDSVVRTVFISPIPQADFSFSNTCFGSEMSFQDQTEAFNDVIFRWSWSFGDGDMAAIPAPSHLYDFDTSYNVQLVATNRAGCSDTISKLVTVHSIPNASFTFLNACEGLEHRFYGDASVKNSGIGYKWHLGNGDSSSAKNPVNVYQDTGNFSISFIATSTFGCADTVTNVARVFPNPVSSFSINNPIQCQKGNWFSFTNTSNAFGDSLALNYWIASDGGTGFNQDYAKAFASYDSFLITHITHTDKGCIDTSNQWIEVLESPNIEVVSASFNVCENGDSLTLQDSGINVSQIAIRSWFLNSVLINSDSIFNYKFNNVGANDLTYVKELLNGCLDTSHFSIEVYPKPEIVLKINEVEQCFAGNQFLFSDSSYISSNQSLARKWFFGNGDSSILANLNYNYLLADTFKVTLEVTSTRNCKDIDSAIVIVHPEPIPEFDIDTTNLCLRGNLFRFENRSSVIGTSMSYVWRFGTEGTSVLQDPNFSFLNHGSKSVKLIASSPFGCQDSIEKGVLVHPMPISIPTVNQERQCFNDQNFIYTDSSIIDNGTLNRKWMWANGLDDTAKVVSQTYLSDTQLIHQLVSVSIFGCADTSQISNTILPVPQSSFAVNDSAQCVNSQQYEFTNQSVSKDGPLTSFWSFGDGTLDTADNTNHRYLASGPYITGLIVLSSQGCFDTSNQNIYVQEMPNAALIVNDSAQCFKGQDFKFAGVSSISIGSLEYFEWDTLNNPFVGSKDTFLQFPNPGTFNVRYVVGSEDNCFDTTSQLITVHPDPQSSFSINDSLQCENDNAFTFTSQGIIDYGSFVDSWYVGQNYFSSTSVSNRQFSTQDTHWVSLVNTSNKGCRDTASKEIYVVPAPQTNFVINDSGQCLGINQFDFGNNSVIEDGSLTYEWTFGDGNVSQVENPGHAYSNHGDYIVQLISTSIYDCKDTSDVLVLVHPEPTADFSVNDVSQCFGSNEYSFTNRSSIDSTSIYYSWDFGDGNISVLEDPMHNYGAYGTYLSKLIVSSIYGCLDSIEQNMVVNPMPISSFSINDSTQCINEQSFVFSSSASIPLGNIVSFIWKNDGVPVSAASPWKRKYLTSGPQRVGLTVVSDSGCVDSTFVMLRVFPKPIADILVNDSVQCLRGNDYIYSQNSFDSFGLQGHQWIQNGQEVSSTDTFQITYAAHGLKWVDLISTSVNNCKDTTQMQVRVKPMPNPIFNPLKSYYCEDELPSTLVPQQQGGVFVGKNVSGDQYIPRVLWEDTVKYIITQEGCTDSSSQFTEVYPLPNADLGNDTTICKHESLLLGATSWNSSFTWSTGSNDSAIRITRPGTYSVIAKNICGTDTASMNLAIRDINCRFFLPTAFTPNDDNHNNTYKPVTFNVDEMTYEIFNRWGEKIYEGDISDNGWDGTYGGKDSPIGYYIIVVKYSYQTDFRLITETASETFYLLK